MKRYRLVSFDLFMTLADLDARVPAIWSGILGRTCSPEERDEYARALHAAYFDDYVALGDRLDFRSLREVFAGGFARVFERYGWPLSPYAASDRFMAEHDLSPLYPDVPDTLARVAARYPVCISSDADFAMANRLLAGLPHDAVFLSEALGCYKRDAHGRFFRAVLDTTRLDPGDILHVGDGASDVIGACRAGIDTCQLLRAPHRRTVTDVRPTYTITSFRELEDILL